MNTKRMKGWIRILTFENVLEIFKDYLLEDTDCEVIPTKHGYTVM